MLDELAEIARMEAGGTPDPPEVLLLQEEIRQAVTGIQPFATNKAIRLSIGDGENAYLHAAHGPVQKILLIALQNATRLTEEGREICLTTAIDHDTSSVVIEFPSNQETRRLDYYHDDAQPYAGAGYGLLACKRLAELIGGSLELNDRPDSFASIGVVFPKEHSVGPDA